MKKIYVILLLLVVAAAALFLFKNQPGGGGFDEGTDKVSFNFEIRPILSDKCYACHGPDPNTREAGLRLDVAEDAYKALKEHPDAHAIVPGKPDLSQVFLRISTSDTSLLMPPASSNLPSLTETEIKLIKKWIEQGAVYETHWAFEAPEKPDVPKVKKTTWPQNEIDYFVLRKMEQHGLTPNEAADKERLLKRITMDITGLPPTPEMTDRFLKDDSPDAYEKMIDELLKQPTYGERMAIPWLDVARYADSHGYQDDNYRTQWPWRDWVIHAFNENMPYDQFVTWQLAGDLLPDANKEHLLATGFNRNHKITEEGGVIDEEYRVSYVLDRTNTVGKAFLGITIECSQCHDHKYDPFSQKEYFELYSFFNNIKEVGLETTVGGPNTYAKNPRMEITREDREGLLSFINQPENYVNKLEVSVMKDDDTVRRSFVLDRGEYDAPSTEVFPATPVSILEFDDAYPKNRLGLSKWLFDDENPLTSRVFVNRIWQEFFGRGIVQSSADFGMQGDLPSHPRLLDWLAVDFRENGWDIKRLVKQILMSATYRQSAETTPEKLSVDPDNIYLSRSPRMRLNAEMLRDLVLFSSGLLDTTIGGPSVKPYQPPGLWEMATSGRGILATYKQDHGNSLYRRGIYTFIKRTVPPPSMMIFDASNRDQCEVIRLRTNTPLQALIMMNDPTVLEASRVLASRLLNEQSTPELAIQEGFQRIVCRTPASKEIEILNNHWEEQKAYYAAHEKEAAEFIKVGEYKLDKNVPATDLAAMMTVLQIIYNMEEAITKT